MSTTALSASEINDLSTCESIILAGKKTFVEVGLALSEIRERRLYRKDYSTFEVYCQQKWGWSHQRSSQLINSASVVQGLTTNLATMVASERAARELAKVPAESRVEVIRAAAKNGAVTAAKVKEAGSMLVSGSDEQQLDETGYAIPKGIQVLWDETKTELREMLNQLSGIRSKVRQVMEARDGPATWRRVNTNSAMIALDNAYREINAGVPYAVCPYCQGKVSKSCTACKQTGFVGRFDWTTSVPRELVAMREKTVKG